MNISKQIAEKLKKEKVETPADLEDVKKQVAKKYGVSFPTNISILREYRQLGGGNSKVLSLLKTRPVRSLSGVVNVSVLTKPYECPGECTYCPEEEGFPKSYLQNEPAVMRAVLNNYEPDKQVKMRLRALDDAGHPTDKIEIRVVGGTWSYYPPEYREMFIKKCFDACNGEDSASLEEAQKKNELSNHRIVCLSIETRPDYVDYREVESLRTLGVTMVEMGVQSLSDDVLRLTKRGHQVEQTIRATEMLKDAGFKVCYQVMPNLPGSNLKQDQEMFKKLFDCPSFRPDFLKIYPCLVLENSELYEQWQKGEYCPYTNEELIELLVDVKKNIIPRYTRIQRLFRDVPVPDIKAGCKTSNLREEFARHGKEHQWRCQCIRCREVKGESFTPEDVVLYREDYNASNGKEVFISYENKDRSKLYALLRLRITQKWSLPSLERCVLVREIRTYGQQVSLQGSNKEATQHRGLGKRLIKEAERIAKEEFGVSTLAVISGVGVRDYWKKQGYFLKDTYMFKDL